MPIVINMTIIMIITIILIIMTIMMSMIVTITIVRLAIMINMTTLTVMMIMVTIIILIVMLIILIIMIIMVIMIIAGSKAPIAAYSRNSDATPSAACSRTEPLPRRPSRRRNGTCHAPSALPPEAIAANAATEKSAPDATTTKCKGPEPAAKEPKGQCEEAQCERLAVNTAAHGEPACGLLQAHVRHAWMPTIASHCIEARLIRGRSHKLGKLATDGFSNFCDMRERRWSHC